MINAEIENLRIVDDELFNRIKAYGPGDGINRKGVTVEDSNSIQKYGVREAVVDFADAVSPQDLLDKANEYLDAYKEPATEIQIKFYFDTDKGPGGQIYEGSALTFGGDEIQYYRFGDERQIRRGDKIRIVSRSLGINTTGVIEELDWEPGAVSLSIGRKRYNLIDVINGPDEDAQRGIDALGLPVPIGLRAQRSTPGCSVFVNPYTNSRATGVEIYISDSLSGFDVTRDNLAAKGPDTRFDFPNLTPGQVFYFKARSYDNDGNFSEPTDPVASVAGGVPGAIIDGGSIDFDKFLPDSRPILLLDPLPAVAPGDDKYSIGTLANNLGVLYKLVSRTGNVSVDWVPAVNGDSIENSTITANNIDAASVRTAVLIANAIKADMIEAGAVTTNKIQVGGVTSVTIENGAITADKIQTNAVTADKIQANAVTANKIQAGAVTTNKIQVGGVTSVTIENGAITADKIATNSISTNKLQAGNVILDNGLGQDGPSNRVRVVSNGQNQVVMGRITGLAGVPSNVDFGFWGSLDTGVFIQGATRVSAVYSGSLSTAFNSARIVGFGGSVYDGLRFYTSFSVPISSFSVPPVVPPGKVLLLTIEQIPPVVHLGWTNSFINGQPFIRPILPIYNDLKNVLSGSQTTLSRSGVYVFNNDLGGQGVVNQVGFTIGNSRSSVVNGINYIPQSSFAGFILSGSTSNVFVSGQLGFVGAIENELSPTIQFAQISLSGEFRFNIFELDQSATSTPVISYANQ